MFLEDGCRCMGHRDRRILSAVIAVVEAIARMGMCDGIAVKDPPLMIRAHDAAHGGHMALQVDLRRYIA